MEKFHKFLQRETIEKAKRKNFIIIAFSVKSFSSFSRWLERVRDEDAALFSLTI